MKYAHQYSFDIAIPQILITNEFQSHDQVHFDLLEGKVIIGLCGYAKSGKDTVAEKFISDYGFNRIAFADNIKKDMNLLMRESVYEDLLKKNKQNLPGYLFLPDFSEIDFVNPKDREIKELLRPYIIWLGEKLREINGPYFWINRAFKYDAENFKNIVISDVRRPKELDPFKGSNTFNDRTVKSLAEGHYFVTDSQNKVNNYGSLLFYVNQYGLEDGDPLTKQTIMDAHENWLFDDTFYIDSRLPEKGKYRESALNHKVSSIAKKFGIKKPGNSHLKQINLFDNN